ncbi:MAG: hypothetical protein ACC660_07375 [Acidimicrobiales bacterium]
MTRLRVTFISLVAVASIALGTLTSALTRAASRTTGVTVAATGVVLAVSLGLGLRLLLAADQARNDNIDIEPRDDMERRP